MTCFICLTASAQLQADFTVDKTGGCSPLSVKFTNTSTGTSASTTYDWVFDNGNGSKLKDPGANYLDEKTYTVTLTIKDGGNTSTKSIDIIVYKKPSVDFSVSGAQGCVPLMVTFTANATPGDGTITKYYWDFGDGKTTQGQENTIDHNYTFPQKPPVSLTVTNSNGCYSSVTKTNLIEAVKSVSASSTTSANSLCKAGDAVSFTGSAVGSGTLSYLWDFGDGQTSSEQSPTHAYAANGAYIAKLNVKSSYGCEANASPITINVNNFIADFIVPAPICQNQPTFFLNNSTAPYDSLQWWVDNINFGNEDGDSLKFVFNSAGEHTIKLTAFYGQCPVSVTKKVNINPSVPLKGFLVELQGACGVPLTINFKDTSSNSTNWEWRLDSSTGALLATTQTVGHTFTTGNSAIIFLTVANSAGCSNSISKTINYSTPVVNILIKAKLGNSPSNTGADCVGEVVNLNASPDSLIESFDWDFGDGSTSTDREPNHIFANPGKYNIVLNYTTKSGCVGKTTYANFLVVVRPNFDFTAVNGNTICGNTPVTLQATDASGWRYYWLFDGLKNYVPGNSTFIYQFEKDTTYSVHLLVYYGNCRDTIIKKNYLTVLPSFTKIKDLVNTCDANRGLVKFVDSSRKALQWQWDFGDGTSDNYSSKKDTVSHTYTQSGVYKVILTTTNAPCSVKDSITTYVLLKQNPILSANKIEICSSDSVSVGLNGLEPNPYLANNADSNYSYKIPYIQYGDFTSQPNTIPFTPNAERTAISATMTKFISGKNGFRLITNSDFFNCSDTTNFLPLKIHGPVAGFTIQQSSDCFKDPVFFTDTSHAFETSAINKWMWNFGDSTNALLNNSGNTSHTFSSPGFFYPSLTVTDLDGCSNTTADSLYKVTLKGPKADFYTAAYTVAPETKVDFFNSSLEYDKNTADLKWIFSDGSQSTAENPSFFFAVEGKYDVKLITINLLTTCTDTIVKTITVRKPNSAFTYTLSYINSNNCPPAIAQFTSSSVGAVRLSWDFGDGSVAGDVTSTNHNYSQPGMYRAVHYSYDANNTVDSTEEFIEVKGPYAILKADTLYACNTLAVRLTAEVRHAKEFTWDFGDGTLVAGTDTFATHTYANPGIYSPALILKDEGGCTGNSVLAQKIIVDSLSSSFFTLPSVICTTGKIQFVANAQSFSQSQLQAPLDYRWIVGNTAVSDTVFAPTFEYSYSTAGKYPIDLRVISPYGCEINLQDDIGIYQSLMASISGPSKICSLDSATFTGNALPYSDTLQWLWDFGIDTSHLQNPPNQVFVSAQQQPISLIVTNGYCSDTAHFTLQVQEIPTISFIPGNPVVCLGDSLLLTATGGINYQWTPNIFIKNANQASPTVWPDTTKTYTVKVRNSLGCTAKDSISVKVIAPLQLTATSPLFACAGNTVQLNASGADVYRWQNASDLDNAQIANPVATTLVNRTYTVIGSDSYQCFSDTAIVTVRIGKLPTVQAGPDYLVKVGTQLRLNAIGSNDVVKYDWRPTDFLTCSNCATTLSTPLLPTNYVVTVATADGCIARDSVRVELICTKDVIYIPTGFTPNGDNLNDRFAIRGSGIKSIKNLVIFDRWGKVVFERKNVDPYDRNSSWDGKYKGEISPTGAYIYILELECEAGEFFNYQGTVTLIR